MGIRLSMLQVSILYFHSAVLWLLFVINFAIFTNLMLWKLITLDFNVFNSLVNTSNWSLPWHMFWNALYFSVSFSTSLLLPLHTLFKWLVHPYFLQSFPNAGHLWGSSIVLQYLHFYRGLFFTFLWVPFVITTLFCLFFLNISKSLLFSLHQLLFFAILLSWSNLTPNHLLSHWSYLLWLILLWFQHHVIINDSINELLFQPAVSLHSQVTHQLLSTFLSFSYQLAVLEWQYYIVMLRFEFLI